MKYLPGLIKIKTLLLLLLLQASSLTAQNSRELNLAASLQRNGSYEQALEIYLGMFSRGLHSYQIINGIGQNYEKLNRFPEMIDFFSRLSKKYPQNINYKLTLGRALFLNGQKDEAHKIWDEILTRKPESAQNYRFVGLTLTGLQQYDEAIVIYKEALKKFTKQERLYGEIARLSQARLDYEQAAEYYLRYYRHFKKQKNYVRSRLTAMTRDTASVPLLLKGLNKFKDSYGSDPFITESEASFYIRLKDFAKAYRLYKKIHEENPARNFLLRFAQTAFSNRAYVFSEKAYRQLADEQRSPRRRDAYLFEIARINYARARAAHRQGNISQGQKFVRSAIRQLQKLTPDGVYPDIRARSMELLGDIQHDYFNDADQAIHFYSQSLQMKRGNLFADGVRLKLAAAYLEKNDLQKSRKNYEAIRSKEIQHFATLRLAELDYYEGQFKKAQKSLELLLHRTSAKDTTFNNALRFSMLIERFISDSLTLARYAHAQLLSAQKQSFQAAKEFSLIFKSGKALSSAAGIKAARIYSRLNQTEKAQKILAAFLTKYPLAEQTDQVIFLLAGIYERQNKTEQALHFYNKLLMEFPLSFYQRQARIKARRLSGKLKEQDAS